MMKVVIQRPLEAGLSRFVNTVYEVELRRPSPFGADWLVLEHAKIIENYPPEGLPVLHKGFYDSHLHMIWSGLQKQDLDLRNCSGFEEALALIEARFQSGAAFVRGFGWDESRWGMTLGSLARLAEARLPAHRPVLLSRVCGHSALASRRLREAAGRAQLGALITDRDLGALNAELPLADQRACEAAFLGAQRECLELGISAVGDMSLDETSVAAIRSLAERGELLLDVVGFLAAGEAPSVESVGPLWVENIGRRGPLDRPAAFCVQHWKRFLDGSLGSRTAWLTRAYEDAESFGESLQESKTLLEEAREALSEGFYLSFHAIGDAALDQALEVGERLGSLMRSRSGSPITHPFAPTRHRLEHVQVVRDDQLRRIAEQGFWSVTTQPYHRVGDAGFVKARLGAQRCLAEGYRAASFLRAGIPACLSSDAPVETKDPMAILSAAMTHENPQERLGFLDAMWWYTTGSRLAAGLDPGRVGPGMAVFLTSCP